MRITACLPTRRTPCSFPIPLTGPSARARPAGRGWGRRCFSCAAAVPDGAIAVALDAGGQPLDSEALAARIGRWQDSGTRDLAFVIGGANGLAPAVLQRADFTLSLGALTWPHMLVRAMLCEQVYRAGSILSGHPYHRGH